MNRKSETRRAALKTRALQGGSLAVLGALIFGIGSPGAAQAASDGQPGAAGSATVGEVVVTGSRIARKDFTSESPIVTVTGESLENSAEVSIDQQLSKLPQFVAGSNQVTSAPDVQATPTNSPGIATINLRGLGTNRTLVLLDGRRTQPNNSSLVVDVNTIPEEALDGVEIITGGAASTYGADAVSGVVNFKLKHNYQGVTLDAQYGETFRGDGAETRVTALVGSNFADNRGNAMIGMVYANRDAVNNADRPFFARTFTDPGTPAGDFFPNFAGFNIIPYTGFAFIPGPNIVVPNTPSQAAVDAIFTPQGFAPGDVSAFSGLYFNRASSTAGATVFSVAHGAVSGKPAPGYAGGLAPDYKLLKNGDLGSNAINGYLSLPITRYSMFANGRYEISEHATVYLQGQFDQNETRTALGGHVPAVNQWGVSIPYDAAHPVPPQLAALLNSRPNPAAPWQLNQELDFLGPRSLDTRTNTYEILAGVKGKIGVRDWTYDLYASHGNTDSLVIYNGFADQARYQALIAMPNYGAGADFNNGLTGLLAHCTSGLNPFVTTAVSQDCINIVNAGIKTSSNLQQDQVELDIQGALMPLPAGDLRFAAGADYRGDTYTFLPDPAMSTTNITSASLGIFDAAPAHGAIHVFEGYGELLVPVLKDMTLAKSLSLDLGYRYSSYDTSGAVSTWKANGDWVVNDWLRFRGGYEVANRAPNVAELFESSTVVVAGWPDSDPCANTTIAPYGNVAGNPNRAKVLALCSALSHGFPITPAFSGQLPFYFPLSLDQQLGNPSLKSENAKTWTVGAVLKSPWQAPMLSRLTASVDYYNISIDGAIAALSSQVIYQECLNGLGTNPSYDPTNPYCQLIIRSPAGFTSTVLGKFTNLGSIKTSGIDVQLDWSADIGDFGGSPGTLFANVQFNWLQAYDVVNAPGGTSLHYAGTVGAGGGSLPYGAQFRWKLYSTIGYRLGPATMSLAWRHLPSAKNVAAATNPATTTLPSGAYDQFDLSARWALTSRYEIRGGIDNLLDRSPQTVGAVPGVTNASGFTDGGSYDVLGRRFYVGFKARF